MIPPRDFGNVHQATKSLFIEDFAIRSEHGSKFKCQHLGISLAQGLILGRFVFRTLTMQASSLEDNRDAAEADNTIHLSAIEFDDVASLIFDVCLGDEGHTRSQRAPI